MQVKTLLAIGSKGGLGPGAVPPAEVQGQSPRRGPGDEKLYY